MTTRLGPRGSFEYDAKYGVLICRECRYAIQKSALRSHLLRHKIYRDERQQLLASIDRLLIREPDNVPLPGPGSPPIDGLDIIPGFSCTITGCEHLCASTKRMRLHQNEAHGHGGSSCSLTVRAVKLQTFFRGTKIRYFAVTPRAEVRGRNMRKHVENIHEINGSKLRCGDSVNVRKNHSDLRDTFTTKQSPPLATSVASQEIKVDLELLSYFHQFSIATHHTLPCLNNTISNVDVWQSVIAEALQSQRHWLISGILAIAAYHLAMTANDTHSAVVHSTQAKKFQSTFDIHRKNSDTLPESVKKATQRIEVALFCIAPEPYGEPRSWILHTFIEKLRILAIDDAAHQASQLVPNRTSSEEGPFTRARRVASATNSHQLSRLLDRIEPLPDRLTEIFGVPEDVRDVVANLSTIAFLIECCTAGFESEHAPTVFQAMVVWLVEMSQYFQDMVNNHNPISLVIVAYWAEFLVRRAEESGCWYLKGKAKIILREIEDLLRPHGSAISDLVAGLSVE